jgi:hypothetical protein
MASPSYALEVFLDGAIGPAFHTRTTPDGVWWQQPFPHSFDLRDVAWKAGLGLRFNEHWSVTGSYVSLGETSARTEAVSDENYDHGDRKDPRVNLSATDRLAGPQLVTSYRWTQWPVQPFLSGGVALLHHYGSATVREYPGPSFNFHGDIPMFVAGGGLCYAWLCGEVTYYRGVHAPNYPISTEAIVPWIGLKIPFVGY